MVGICPPIPVYTSPLPPVSPPYRGFWCSKTPHNAVDKIFLEIFIEHDPPYILKVGKLEKKFLEIFVEILYLC